MRYRRLIVRAKSSLVAGIIILVAFAIPALGSAAGGGGGAGGGGAPAATSSASGSAGASAAASGGTAASGTSGYQNGSLFLRPSQRTLYVLVYGPDASTTNYVAYEVSLLLGSTVHKDPKKHAAGSWRMMNAINEANVSDKTKASDDSKQYYWVLPEPGWTLADFATQCQNDMAHTVGALVIYDIENDSGSFSWLLLQNTYTHLYAKAALIECKAAYDIDQEKPLAVGSLQTSTVVNAGSDQNPAVSTQLAVTTKATEPPQQVKTTSSPPPRVVTKTLTATAVPEMNIVWQNTDMLSGHRLQRSVPFLAFAGLVTYLATRYTVPTTTTTTTTLPSPTASGGTIATGTSRTYNGATDLPLSLAVLGSTIGGLSSSSVGGANQSRVLKNAAAALATRLINLWADACGSDQDHKDPSACNGLNALGVFNQKSIQEFSARNRAEATKP
jgi:hypothetical protein